LKKLVRQMHQEELKIRQQRKGHNELNIHDAI
jgi:hypothetical protein